MKPLITTIENVKVLGAITIVSENSLEIEIQSPYSGYSLRSSVYPQYFEILNLQSLCTTETLTPHGIKTGLELLYDLYLSIDWFVKNKDQIRCLYLDCYQNMVEVRRLRKSRLELIFKPFYEYIHLEIPVMTVSVLEQLMIKHFPDLGYIDVFPTYGFTF